MIKALPKALLALICLLLQLSVNYIIYKLITDRIEIIDIIYSFICLYIILKIIKDSKSYSYSLPWILIFMMFPIPGSIIYLTIKLNLKLNRFVKHIKEEDLNSKKYLVQDENIRKEYIDNSSLRYISNYAKYPITCNNDIEYFSLGDYSLDTIISELKKAKKFIFLEYFIVHEGKMWNSMLEVLEEKAKEGVEVRVMYDDLGSLTTLKGRYNKILEKKGIKCVKFNPVRPFAGVVMNNRDHRKILVIDGKVAFSGGINLADEYINIGSKYGHWKDNCFKIEGDAVWNYTVMFLSLWNASRKTDTNYEVYKYKYTNKKNNKGFVAPYGENPLDDEYTGEDIYLNIINNSNKYVYIFTPYLIIDHDVMDALTLASKRGVDVRIVIPEIPDKKMVYTISESYVEPLVKAGVKVYKYTPGFIHAKVFVSDDIRATVGTLNMDYRSLYLHFECGCYFEGADVIKDIKKDALETFEKSKCLNNEKRKENKLKSFWQSVLRLFAPLM